MGKTGKPTKYPIINLKPSQIYFTHSKISDTFTGCNKKLKDTLQELSSDIKKIINIPLIRVQSDGSKYISMNNRRLWVFKQLEAMGLLEEINVYIEYIKKDSKNAKNDHALEAKITFNKKGVS